MTNEELTMTNEEAKEILINEIQQWKDNPNLTVGEPLYIALYTAIEALEITSCIKEKCAYCPHCDNCDVDDETLEIKTLEQQFCEDAISREDVINIIEDVCPIYKNDYRFILEDEIAQLPSVTPKAELYEDCISRAYIEPIIEELENICINGGEQVLSMLADIKNAPLVTTKQKTGKWKLLGYRNGLGHVYNCSECGETEFYVSNYCPNCGCRMAESEEFE